MLYRGVFRTGETYHPGDTVTWGGSLWHCNSMTGDKPGEAHSSGWTLAAKTWGGCRRWKVTALLTLEEIKAHLRVDHDADDEMLMDKVRQATAVLLAYIRAAGIK